MMEETMPTEMALKETVVRKRHLADIENDNKARTPLRVCSSALAAKKTKPDTNDDAKGEVVSSSTNTMAAKTMPNSDDDDVLVISPPPASRPGSRDGNTKAAAEANQNGSSNNNADEDEDCVMEWSNASNVLVEFSHGRPDCGVHSFTKAANRKQYCDKCYCVVCDILAEDCKQWEEHCQQTKQLTRSDCEESDSEDNASNVIDVEQTNDTRNTTTNTTNLATRRNHYRAQATAQRMENDNRWNEYTPGLGGNNHQNYDHHFTKEFNEAYNNSIGGRKERGRNPKDMRITEVLAEKLQQALQISEGIPSTSSKAPITTTASTSTDDDVRYSSRTEQLKKRFGTSKMEGDIPQLGLHKSFFVEGVRIGWPYPSILTPQRQMAIHLVKALKNSRHVVLESPTGTGKSAAILCAALAWQRHHAKSVWGKTVGKDAGKDAATPIANPTIETVEKKEKFPRIIYCSRTHSQVAQMVASLKKTPYRPRMAVLGSRDRLCIHKNIKDRDPSGPGRSENKPKVNINLACQMRVANTEKIRKSLFKSNDFYYDDNNPPESLPGDGNGSGEQEDEDDDNGVDDLENSAWILRNSTKKLTCPHYRQLASARTTQMARSKFLVNQDTIDCCKSGGAETKMGVHDVEDLLAFGLNPYLEKSLVLYRRNDQESFGLDVGSDCRIASIQKDGAAKFNGQLQVGDKILAVNGKIVPSVGLLKREIAKAKSDMLALRVLRSTSPSAINLNQDTGEAKQTSSAFTQVDVVLYRPEGQKGFGMTLEGVDRDSKGCSVNGVKPGTAAAGHVRQGDILSSVNGESVENESFAEIVGKIQATKSDPLRLSLRRQELEATPVDEDIDADMNDIEENDEEVYSPHSACPYYMSKALSKHAELIFAPYNYILDPGIRNALEISLEGSVVVLDEGHNVEGTLAESGSGQWGEIELSNLVALLSLHASSARKQAFVEINGKELDITEIAHDLLLFVEKLVLHLQKARTSFERSTGNLGAAKAIVDYRRFNTPDNAEFEVSYSGPSGHGVRRNGKQEALGCQPFLESLKLSDHEVTQMLEYAIAMESHVKGNSSQREGDGTNDKGGGKSTFDLLLGLLSTFSLATQTPEHFYVSVAIKANGNLDHAAGEDGDMDQARRRRFRKKPTTMPFIYPRGPHNPTALLPVCTHKTCKQGHNGTSLTHGDYCDGTSTPPWEAHLVVKLLFPGLLMKDLVSQCRTVVLASGSISPLQSVCAELDLQSAETTKSGRLQTKPKPLEANHVISLQRQLLAVAVGTFPDDGSPLTVNYNNYKHPEFFPRLGEAIANVVESIPSGGCLVFFPSYSVLNKCVKCWNPSEFAGGNRGYNDLSSPDIWERFIRSKGSVIVEPTGSQDLFEAARDDYASAIKTYGSCILLGVFRGKMSEGISFNDENARGVICVGLPFPSAKDRAIVAKKAYNDEQRKLRQKTNFLPGGDWYVQECFRAVAQALGRCIRHEGDYGTVVLLDSRHCNDGSPGFQHSKLPKWMRNSVRTMAPTGSRGFGQNPVVGGYDGLKREMESFFAQAPRFTEGVLAKRKKEFEDALQREKQSGRDLQYDSKSGWAPSSSAAAAKCKASQSVGFGNTSKRVTQDSPMPPSASYPVKTKNGVIDLLSPDASVGDKAKVVY